MNGHYLQLMDYDWLQLKCDDLVLIAGMEICLRYLVQLFFVILSVVDVDVAQQKKFKRHEHEENHKNQSSSRAKFNLIFLSIIDLSFNIVNIVKPFYVFSLYFFSLTFNEWQLVIYDFSRSFNKIKNSLIKLK